LNLEKEGEEGEEEDEEEKDEEEDIPLGWRFSWFHQLLQVQIIYNTHSCLHITVQKPWSF
jgi:hypothetical protein